MYKQIVVYTYTEIAFSYKIKWYMEYHKTNESQNNYAEWKQPDKKEYILYDRQ